MSDVTQLLNAIEAGEPKAADQLLPLVYEELPKLSTSRPVRWIGIGRLPEPWLKRTSRTSLSGRAGAD